MGLYNIDVNARTIGDLVFNWAQLKKAPNGPLVMGVFTEEVGVGSVAAAIVLVAWGYPSRIRSEAAFAALAGASPLPASSGTTIRYQLNRGGDRKLNRVLNVIAMHRMVHHQDTRYYVDKRLAQGKTYREIRRSLKCYLARRYYRHLNNEMEAKDKG